MRRRSPRHWRAPATSASRCSSRTFAATSARTARRGRVYLPLAWLREAASIGRVARRAGLRRRIAAVVRRLLRHADTLYARVEAASRCCRPRAAPASRPRACSTPRSGARSSAAAATRCRSVRSFRAAQARAARARTLAEGRRRAPRTRGRPAAPRRGPLPGRRGGAHRCAAARRGAARRARRRRAARGAVLAFAKRAVWVIALCERQEQRRPRPARRLAAVLTAPGRRHAGRTRPGASDDRLGTHPAAAPACRLRPRAGHTDRPPRRRPPARPVPVLDKTPVPPPKARLTPSGEVSIVVDTHNAPV